MSALAAKVVKRACTDARRGLSGRSCRHNLGAHVDGDFVTPVLNFVAAHLIDIAAALVWLLVGVAVQKFGDRIVRPRPPRVRQDGR